VQAGHVPRPKKDIVVIHKNINEIFDCMTKQEKNKERYFRNVLKRDHGAIVEITYRRTTEGE